jgi:hypothetical protein
MAWPTNGMRVPLPLLIPFVPRVRRVIVSTLNNQHSTLNTQLCWVLATSIESFGRIAFPFGCNFNDVALVLISFFLLEKIFLFLK